MKFDELGLSPEILQAVHDAGYTDPTPIQQQAIPVVLAGHDLMGGAQTGTGKTAGFTLPLLHRLLRHANASSSPARHPVRALILTPTRELAMQVEESVKTYSKHVPLRSVCIYGGVDMKAQIAELKEGREIVVATPGRLLDHVQQKTVSFNFVEFLVLDEADRMLDMGFIPDIKRIIGLLPKERQSLLFSATFSDEIKRLADAMLRQPQLIEVARRNTVSETISHRVHPVSADHKRHLLLHLLRDPGMTQVLVFVGTKFGASRLASWLERQGIKADAIHGDKSQQQRTEALEAFKSGNVRVLVATDVAARGLDIDDLPHVINYELPHTAEDYVHRIGRTGRAGKKGEAISFFAPEEKQRLADIEKLIKFKIDQVEVADFDVRGLPADGGDRERGERTGRGHGHQHRERERERHGPKVAVRLPETSAHLPETSARPPSAKRATSGFDASKPYEPTPEAAARLAEKPDAPPRRPVRPVAALLGGLGKK
ncbi:MAG: DEAD/DEAH box helicase [Gammaproteobacteria bacterium]|nr:DEAD/DEAH box helicase [Gammaproteobacteria bacterium]MBU1646060.1 DEAD/DEAH box helicase [Gammaproteobacteria bacterium]MBU1972122.1 DEAD/DEAH box helicase [Gammaproteobacteria bacterium]